MRVAHLVHGLGLGGAQKVIGSIIRRRSDPDIQYFVYTPLDGELRPEIEQAGARVRVIPRLLPKMDPIWTRRLRAQLIRDRIQLVHAHLFGDSLHGYLAVRAADRIPMVITLHIGSEGMTYLQKTGYRWLISRQITVVACSESVRKNVLNQVAEPGASIRVIHNGIPKEAEVLSEPEIASLRADLGYEPQDVLIGAFGRLERQKGYEYLIAAFGRLCGEIPKQSLKLAFFGGGSLRSELESQVAKIGPAKGRVKFHGFIDDVPRALQAVSISAFSSLYEGLPIALLESMRAGTCIIGTAIPGIAEAVQDNQEAILVPCGNAHALCEGLRRAAEDEELRQSLGQRARTRFLDLFTDDRMSGDYERLYVQLVHGSPSQFDSDN